MSSRVTWVTAVRSVQLLFRGGIVKYSKKSLIFLTLVAVCLLSLGGCYTRLASYQGEVTESGSGGGVCGDCRDEVPFTGNRQVCVWERDFFGYPELRCYYTSYASSWLYFHNTPWWYRSSFGWRDTRGCPPHYYYDRIADICRYYGGEYSRPNTGTGGGGGGGGGAVVGSDRPRPQMRGVRTGTVSPEPPAEGGGLAPMFSGGANKQLSPVGTPITPSASVPSSSKPAAGSDAGMSKPHGGDGQPSNPPAEQKPEEKKQPEKKPNERPRPSMRGM